MFKRPGYAPKVAVSFNYADCKPKIHGTQYDKYKDIYGNKREN